MKLAELLNAFEAKDWTKNVTVDPREISLVKNLFNRRNDYVKTKRNKIYIQVTMESTIEPYVVNYELTKNAHGEWLLSRNNFKNEYRIGKYHDLQKLLGVLRRLTKR